MITHDQLMLFCSTDKTRTNLTQPSNQSAYTYATNGHFAVRIPRRPEYQENNETKFDICKFQERENIPIDTLKPLTNFPEIFETKKCENCNGKGKDVVCDDCEGKKYITFESNNGYEYDVDCKCCNETGIISGPCETCGATGSIAAIPKITIGTKLLDCNLLRSIAQLPGVMIATEASAGLDPIPFIFDGGIGIIMPMRKFN